MQPMMKKHGLSREESMAILSETVDGTLCTNGFDGYPYGTPVNFILVDGKIFFHGRIAGEKLDNISRDPKVCFTVYSYDTFEIYGSTACDIMTNYKCVIVRGNCSQVTDPVLKEAVLSEMVKKIIPDGAAGHIDPKMIRATAVFCIVPESITGKAQPAMPGNRTFQIQ